MKLGPSRKGGAFLVLYVFFFFLLRLRLLKISQHRMYVHYDMLCCEFQHVGTLPTHLHIAQDTLTLRNSPGHYATHLNIVQHNAKTGF